MRRERSEGFARVIAPHTYAGLRWDAGLRSSVHQRSRARQRGVVIIITLLAMVLLASMVFYVFNVGRHVQKRVETQNAADAAAISGAGWVARSYNNVAMNNVEMARLIALAGVLDAVPLAVQHTLEDQQVVFEAIQRQLGNGVRDAPWLEDGLREAQGYILRQLELLDAMNTFFNESGYDVASMTAYKSSSGERGDIWEALESLAALNQATMENLGVLAQHNAYRGAQINQREAGIAGAGGVLLPWVPSVPWTMNSFETFRDPVVDGLLPEGQDDKEFNRGPFDVLFGWRNRTYRAIRENIERDVERDYSLQSWVPPPPTQRTVRREATGYSTWGTYMNMRALGMQIGVGPQGVSSRYFPAPPTFDEERPLAPSLWARRIAFIADRKINFAFPGAASNVTVYDPEWITDYDGARALEESGTVPIHYGLYLVFTYLRESYGNQQGFPVLQEWGLARPDYDATQPPALEKITEHVWRDERVENLVDDRGTPSQLQYTRYYVFVGVNVGREVGIRNPYNFDEEDKNLMPGPINFTPGEVTHEPADRAEYMSFLGIAHQSKAASFWSQAFDADRPDTELVALAQAEVFNNHSWDLWTQMWHAQLVPVRGYEGWVEQLGKPAGLSQMPWLDEEQLGSVTTYLEAVAPLADVMLEH